MLSGFARVTEIRIRDGRFRRDLYYRINTFPIHVPPLRERPEDLPLLVTSLLERVAPQQGVTVSDAAMELLATYPFPGNVRELRNVLERASLMCDGKRIEPEGLPVEFRVMEEFRSRDHLPVASQGETGDDGVSIDIRQVERELLMGALKAHRGGRRELAQKLGLSERTLYRRLRATADEDK